MKPNDFVTFDSDCDDCSWRQEQDITANIREACDAVVKCMVKIKPKNNRWKSNNGLYTECSTD